MTPNRPIPLWLYMLTAVMGAAGVVAHLIRPETGFDTMTTVAQLVQYAAPLVIGIAVAATKPTYGIAALRAVALSTAAVLLPAPAMAQSLVCLIVMVPFVVVIAPIVAVVSLAIIDATSKNKGTVISSLLAISVVTGSLPSANEQANEPLVLLRDSVRVEGSRERVWASIDEVQMPMMAEVPLWQYILLPRPTFIKGGGAEVGSLRSVYFSNGYVEARVTDSTSPSSFGFDLEVHATGPEFFDHFVDLRRSDFEFSSLPDGATQITHSTWYRPLAYPRWYFEPIERVLGSYLQTQLLEQYRAQLGREAYFVQQ